MPSPNRYKTVELKPLMGPLDLASDPDNLAYGHYRWLENVAATARGKICRRPGYTKLLSESNYNNADLHDQLLSLAGESHIRQPITSLYQAESVSGVSKLLAATQNRIYAFNAATRNWHIISDILGGDAVANCNIPAWQFASVEDITVITNGSDPVQYWAFEQPVTELLDQSVAPVQDLTRMGVTRVGCVCAWKGIMFYANVTEEGTRVDHKVIWSDFRKPLAILPSGKSIAGQHVLGSGESILAMKPLADSLLIYTSKSIWEAVIVGGDEVIAFRQRFTGPNGALAYPRTLINTGDEHLYFGRDGIYTYSFYLAKPMLVDWIENASSFIFEDISRDACASHVGGWNPADKEAWFSWTKSGQSCPSQSLVLSLDFHHSDIVNEGFTSFTAYNYDRPKTVREWIREKCICTTQGLADSGNGYIKEGQYCYPHPADPDCPSPPNVITNGTAKEWDPDGSTTEDWTEEPSGLSLCAQLEGVTLEDLCRAELAADECNPELLFVMARASDFCLKSYGTVYYHERCTSFTSCGTYTLEGYETILRSGPIDFRAAETVKNIRRFLVNFIAEFQTVPSKIQLRIGASYQPVDPNTDDCALVWKTMALKDFQCASKKTSAQHAADNTRQGLGTEWAMFIEGRYLYWELKITGTGGAGCFTSAQLEIANTGSPR